MKSNLSLGKFRSEIGLYSGYQLVYDDPLSPLTFSVKFDHAAVNLSASPYIALKNDVGSLCLSHIQSIKKRGKTDGYQSYIFECSDFSVSDEPIPVRYILNCT